MGTVFDGAGNDYRTILTVNRWLSGRRERREAYPLATVSIQANDERHIMAKLLPDFIRVDDALDRLDEYSFKSLRMLAEQKLKGGDGIDLYFRCIEDDDPEYRPSGAGDCNARKGKEKFDKILPNGETITEEKEATIFRLWNSYGIEEGVATNKVMPLDEMPQDEIPPKEKTFEVTTIEGTIIEWDKSLSDLANFYKYEFFIYSFIDDGMVVTFPQEYDGVVEFEQPKKMKKHFYLSKDDFEKLQGKKSEDDVKIENNPADGQHQTDVDDFVQAGARKDTTIETDLMAMVIRVIESFEGKPSITQVINRGQGIKYYGNQFPSYNTVKKAYMAWFESEKDFK